VTVVGDRGMIKSAQNDQMPQGIHYITAITKPQIDKLIDGDIIRMGLLDDRVCEVQREGIRYVLRCNPYLEVDEAVLVEKSKIAGNY